MADQITTAKPNNQSKPIDPNDLVTVDLYNPTRSRRVIFDGIGENPKCIVIESGETKTAVRLHRSIERELYERNRLKKDSDLVPKPVPQAA